MKHTGSVEIWHSVKSKVTFTPILLEGEEFRGGKQYVFEGYISMSTYNKLRRVGKINEINPIGNV